jgi:hypothetical protein
VAFDEDLDLFFGTDDFAVAATIGTSTVNVIYDRDYLRSLGLVSGANPIALAKASASVAAVGSTIVISGTSFTIRDRQPQDDGATVLLELEAQ